MRRQLSRGLAGVVAAAAMLALGGAPAEASHSQVAMFEDGGVTYDTGPTLATLRSIGAQQIRLSIVWSHLAPRPLSHKGPKNFNGANPAAYARGQWAPYDAAIEQIQASGMTVNLDLSGGAPLWATGPGAPRDKPHPSWEPSPRLFGQFAHAVAERYSGNYNPNTNQLDPGNPADLPKVTFWSVWNEPNFGPSLAPQGLPGKLYIEHAPEMYRKLLDSAWSALTATGHRSDTILFGEVAPRGYPPRWTHGIPPWGVFSGIKPLDFLRVLYCLNGSYRPLRGSAAALRGCPTTSAGTRAFRRNHPALFDASGFADHPYSRWWPPNVERPNDPEYSSLADIGQLERGLDRVQRAYGSGKRLPVWNTEYGYLTRPPKHSTRTAPVVTEATAAAYLNQAEYMSWRDPRMMSFMQYLLRDPERPTKSNAYGGFASGLETWNGHPKLTFAAWRLPLYLPRTRGRRGGTLEVWGCARPAAFALRDVPADAETVQIQWAPPRSGRFTTVASHTITDSRGYFDTHVRFPGSGTVRLTWSYPPGDAELPASRPVYSRNVKITLR